MDASAELMSAIFKVTSEDGDIQPGQALLAFTSGPVGRQIAGRIDCKPVSTRKAGGVRLVEGQEHAKQFIRDKPVLLKG